jgi:excisionase family DNA binding protein
MDELLTVKQTAIVLKVHHLTIRRYINEGKLKAVRAAGNVRIPLSSIKEFQETYIPTQKSANKQTSTINNLSTTPFAPNDSLFRLRGRGVSLDNLK